MARPKGEINVERCKRFKTICDELDITQMELSERLHISQQTISGMVRGKANVTDQTAHRMIELFPEYRYEWLVAIDDFKTRGDYYLSLINDSGLKESVVSVLAEMAGYSVTNVLELYNRMGESKEKIEELCVRGEHYMVEKDDAAAFLDASEWVMFEKEIIDLVGIRLKYLLESKTLSKEKDEMYSEAVYKAIIKAKYILEGESNDG